jgi:hypothetical protein
MTQTALVSLQERMKAELTNMRNTVMAPSGRNISTKGKVFTFPDQKTSQGPITAVILDHRNFNTYYTAAYNPQNPIPPKCFSISKDLEMKPHADCGDPQNETCAACTWNKWGSAATGKGKACRNQVKLAIAAPDMTANDEPLIIKISPTGLKSWAALVNGLETIGLIPMQVLTEISFDPNAAYPTLVFKVGKAIEEGQLETMWALREKAQAMLEQTPVGAD